MLNKKAAMFGLFQAYKKQSGRLFLARRQSADSIETHGSFKLTRAAMFGLDARIALAIFGALSVISGAALYSAIQESKAIAYIAEAEEVGKAYDAYFLDTGTKSDLAHSGLYLNILELIKSTKTGWSGPYISYAEISPHTHVLSHPNGGGVSIAEMFDGTWTDNDKSATWNSTTRCTDGTVGGNCGIWIIISGMNQSTYDAIDKKIDGSVDSQNGRVRSIVYTGISPRIYYLYRLKSN